jgi:hypothetical protein
MKMYDLIKLFLLLDLVSKAYKKLNYKVIKIILVNIPLPKLLHRSESFPYAFHLRDIMNHC